MNVYCYYLQCSFGRNIYLFANARQINYHSGNTCKRTISIGNQKFIRKKTWWETGGLRNSLQDYNLTVVQFYHKNTRFYIYDLQTFKIYSNDIKILKSKFTFIEVYFRVSYNKTSLQVLTFCMRY